MFTSNIMCYFVLYDNFDPHQKERVIFRYTVSYELISITEEKVRKVIKSCICSGLFRSVPSKVMVDLL